MGANDRSLCPFRLKAATGRAADVRLEGLIRKAWWLAVRVYFAIFRFR
jgi:hypothetical protein